MINELVLKLKTELIRQLIKNKQNMDIPYFIKGDKTYTRQQLANEIENDTPLGIELLTSMLTLAIDITIRKVN